ncbi:MAG TPA: hypothetical protein PK490_19280 [Prosthecobacter sp.]|nr:hypothetical protein [Prosthecobacter sp.]HRK16432.1 hypothetical protein [Prosthecobacter sp.]
MSEMTHQETTTNPTRIIHVAQASGSLLAIYTLWRIWSSMDAGDLVKMSAAEFLTPIVLINAATCLFCCGWVVGIVTSNKGFSGCSRLGWSQIGWFVFAASDYVAPFYFY